MTAPRKPVAWAIGNPDGTMNRLGAIYHSERLAQDHINSYKPDHVFTAIPLYTAPDLQPLWALVEKYGQWSDERQDKADMHYEDGDAASAEFDSGMAEAYARVSDELRLILEAMQ